MPLQAVKTRSLADQVFAQLVAEIVGARYVPGDALPAERELAEVFDVNRHVVREALKRLAQANLVKITQGGHTRVLDYQHHAGLEMLALIAEHTTSDTQAMSHWFAVLEMRAALTAEIARLCALRGSRELRDELVQLTEKMQATTDSEALCALEQRFWDRVLEGADNIAFRLAFNSLLKSTGSMGSPAYEMTVREIKASGYRVALARAIAEGDADAAEAETREHMRAGLAAVTPLFGHARSVRASAVEGAEREQGSLESTAQRVAGDPPVLTRALRSSVVRASKK